MTAAAPSSSSTPTLAHPHIAMGSIDALSPSLTDDVEVILLGTGTSSTVPHVDCLTAPPGAKKCKTCWSTLYPEGKKNIRVRTLFCAGPLRHPGLTLTPPDLIMIAQYLRRRQSPRAERRARVSTPRHPSQGPRHSKSAMCVGGVRSLCARTARRAAHHAPEPGRLVEEMRAVNLVLHAPDGPRDEAFCLLPLPRSPFLHVLSSAACTLLRSSTRIQDHCHRCREELPTGRSRVVPQIRPPQDRCRAHHSRPRGWYVRHPCLLSSRERSLSTPKP